MESSTSGSQSQNVHLKKENQRLTQENQSLNKKIKLLQQQMTQLLHQKLHSQSAHKQQVAPKKCSHNHDHGHNHSHGHGHGHGHSHGHNHGHGHGHNDEPSSEQQNPSEPSTPVLPPAPKAFLHKIFKSQEEINFKYFRLPAKTVKAWKKDENIDLTKNKSCMLHLREMKLNVSDFVNQRWQQVQWINLPECEIDDQGWRKIVDNAGKSFPDLRVIGIRWNKIKTIKQGDLQSFKNLLMIDFGLESQENNPLTQESRQVVKKFAENHPNVKVQ